MLQGLPSTAEKDAGLAPGPADPNAQDAGDTVIPDTGSTDSNGQAVVPPDTSNDSSDMAGELLYGEAGDVLGKSYEGEVDLPMPMEQEGLDMATAMMGFEGLVPLSTFGGPPHAHYHEGMDEFPTTLDSFAAISDSPASPITSFSGADVEDLDWGAAHVMATEWDDVTPPTPDFAGDDFSGEMYPNLYRETTIKL